MRELENLRLLVDGEIIPIARRQAPDSSHDAMQLFPGILQMRDILDLHLDYFHIARVLEGGHHLPQGNDRLVVELTKHIPLLLQHADHLKGPLANHDLLPERRLAHEQVRGHGITDYAHGPATLSFSGGEKTSFRDRNDARDQKLLSRS